MDKSIVQKKRDGLDFFSLLRRAAWMKTVLEHRQRTSAFFPVTGLVARTAGSLVLFVLLFFPLISHAYPVDQCAADRKSSDLGCNAKDVKITGMSVIGDTTSCVGGSPITLDLQMTVNFGASSANNIGIFIPKDGKNPLKMAINGGAATCTVSVLPPASPFLNLDGDGCGDGKGTIGGGTGSGIQYMPGVTVPCQSLTGAGGNLYIPFVISWDSGLCNSNLDPVPSTTSKCNAPDIVQGQVTVVVLPAITKSDGITTISSGDTTDYNIVITNTTGVALSNIVLTDPAVSGITANSLACVAVGGATCPASSTIVALQGAGITLPTMPSGGSLTFTLNATLTGNPSETRTNKATVTVGGQSNSASDTDMIVGVIAILPPTFAKSGAKGASILYNYTLYNYGATTDTISLSAVSSQGWTVSLSSTSISVAAGGSANFTVTVTIPNGASLGTVDTTLMTATSGNNPSKTATSTAVTTVVTLLTLTPSNTGDGGVGSSVYYSHRVQSNDSSSRTVSLTPSFTSGVCTGWTSALFESDKTTSLTSPVTLAANGGYKDLVLKIGIPFDAAVASTCTATLTAAYTTGAANSVAVTDLTTVKNLILYEDTGYSTEQYTYPTGNNVYAKTFGLTNGTPYYYKWLDPAGTVMRTSPVTSNLISLPDTYNIPAAGPLGTWTVQIWNDTTNTIFVQTNFYVGPDHLKANFAGGSQGINSDVVVDLALHDKVNHLVPFDVWGNLVQGNPADLEGPLMITVTVSGSAQIVSPTTLLNATITGQSVTGKLSATTGTATLTIRDAVPETVTITPASYKSVLYGSPVRDEPGTVTFIAVATIDHFRIDHTGSALTCQRADVTVRACQTADCATLYANPVNVTMLPTGWVGGDSKTMDGGAPRTFQLRHNTAGTATLGIASSSVPATNPTQCYLAGVLGSCGLEFVSSGFVFNVPDQTSCQTSPAVTISAVKANPADPQACIADGGFANISKTINFWSSYLSPETGTKSLQVNATTVATVSPGTPVTLDFNNSAQSSFTVAYADAGQLQLNAQYDGSGEEADLVMTGSDAFVVKPARLDIFATTDGTTALDNSGSTGTPIWPAGNNFFVAVQGVCADATVTPNFSAATTLVAVDPFQPATGTLGSLTNGAILATDYSAGVASKSNIQYDEVGTMTLKAEVADYLGTGLLSGISGVIGRFTPRHFLLSGVPIITTRSDLACAPVSTFTYMGEPFKIQFGLEAQNAANGRTNNYTGAYAKLNPATSAPFNFGAVSPGPPATPLTARLDLGIAPVGSWLDGVGDFTVTMALNRGAAVDGPFDNLALGMAPLDTDNVAYRSADLDLDADLNASNERIRLATTPLRYGRLTLQNAYGSELLALTMPLRAEYYDGTNFVTNPADSCTPYAGATAILDNYLFNLQAGETSASGAGTLLAGAGNLQLSAPATPTEVNDGSVDVTLPTDSWLRFDWDSNVGTPESNPKARGSFGIYKGNPRLIYLREVVY